jgi:hypothetical protein
MSFNPKRPTQIQYFVVGCTGFGRIEVFCSALLYGDLSIHLVGNIEMYRSSKEFELNPSEANGYVVMSNVHVASNKFVEAMNRQ